MNPLLLQEFHRGLNARFGEVNGQEVVADYGDVATEFAALRESAGVIDLSCRSRICLTGADRVSFLHGQVTNDVKRLAVNQGCYAALTNAKGKLESDLFIFALADELLLDFEPGVGADVMDRLNKFIIAEDVEVVDVAALYGLLSVQGPESRAVVNSLELGTATPTGQFQFAGIHHATLGEIYLINQPRLHSGGFDLFVPVASLGAVADKLIAAARGRGGRACGWEAFEMARIAAGIPRFGADMDASNLAPETIPNAINYSKGCYIGQEVIARIRTYGQVAKALRRLEFADDLQSQPATGDKLFHHGKEVGRITSTVKDPASGKYVGLGIIRRECNAAGTILSLRPDSAAEAVTVMGL